MPNMNYTEFTDLRNRWEAEGFWMMTREMVEQFDSFFANRDQAAQYQSEGFYRAQAGDFSLYETVEPMMKGYLGAKKCYDLYDRYHGDITNPDLQKEIKNRLMEADLRAGFALAGKNPGDPVSEFFKDCEKIANRQMLIQTLEDPDPAAKLRLLKQLEQKDPANAREKLKAALNEDLEQRVEIAKMLFMNHLGKFQTYDSQNQQMEANENMAEVYTHGGRTMFILPEGADQQPVMDGIHGSHQELSGLQSRGFATHGVEPRTFKKDGSIASEAKELKLKGLSTYSPGKHRGMNASVGGLGQVGPNGKVITADGTNGHMYMHVVPGGKNTCGMMLVGFENSGPGKKGRLGSTHDARAKKAGGSAFLSDKSYLGKERGGRVVDLSGMSGKELGDLLKSFEKAYRDAAKAAQFGDSHLLDACNDLLTGKTMSAGQLKGLLQGLDIPESQIKLVEQAKAGHSAAAGYNKISAEANPAIPMKIQENTEKKQLLLTELDEYPRPKKPEMMKKPGFWDKVRHALSLNSKNSYVSKYKEYQRTLPEKMAIYRREMMEYNSVMDALKRGQGPKEMQEAYNRAVDSAIGRAQSVLGISAEKPAALKPQEKVGAVVKPASKQVADQLENTLADKLSGKVKTNGVPENKLEEQKKAFREHIRETEGFKKLIRSGDDHVNGVLGDPEKMNVVFSDITNEIKVMTGYDQPQRQNDAPQINNERVVEPAVKEPRIMGL